MNKYLISSLLLLSCMQHTHSMQHVQQHPIVRGDVFIIMNGLYYCGHRDHKNLFEHLVDENGTPLPIQANDVIVQVWPTSKECDNWGSSQHWELGVILERLPLFLLEGKYEGDTVAFYVKNPQTQEIFDVRLVCRQRPYRYGWNNFHTVLKNAIEYFLFRPIINDDVMTEYLQYLLTYKILVANPKYDKNDRDLCSPGMYTHGPNGYRSNAPYDPRTRDTYEVIESESGDLHIEHTPK